ncbi:MAG TPA: M28 family peptidase [Edaphocola sp.]|nr:M28 family peptidase [Edaphocola sp.]
MKILFPKQVLLLMAGSLLFLSSCRWNNDTKENDNNKEQTEVDQLIIPVFNETNAYQHIEKQVSFGPRIPNTKAQVECAEYLESTLKGFVDTVYRQETKIKIKDGSELKCINLIGSINPSAAKRLLLLAHWDSRPWANMDDPSQPVLGANDGASGVGVLLELANVLHQNKIKADFGIDILFTDVEDYGKSEWGEESYALGTQYWARNPHVPGYKAFGGILLDMVGGRNARFAMEGYSQQYASGILQAVWKAAAQAGYSSYFVFENGATITDDHVFVNKLTKIPTIDIIDLPRNSTTGFVAEWHTTKDDMSNIDKATLKAVGQTLLQYIYSF